MSANDIFELKKQLEQIDARSKRIEEALSGTQYDEGFISRTEKRFKSLETKDENKDVRLKVLERLVFVAAGVSMVLVALWVFARDLVVGVVSTVFQHRA